MSEKMIKRSSFSPKRALMYWGRIAGLKGGTKPDRFAKLAILRWGNRLAGIYTARGYCYASLAKQVEAIVKQERGLHAARKFRAVEAQALRNRGLI